MGAEVTHVSSVQHSRKSKQLGSKEDKGLERILWVPSES